MGGSSRPTMSLLLLALIAAAVLTPVVTAMTMGRRHQHFTRLQRYQQRLLQRQQQQQQQQVRLESESEFDASAGSGSDSGARAAVGTGTHRLGDGPSAKLCLVCLTTASAVRQAFAMPTLPDPTGTNARKWKNIGDLQTQVCQAVSTFLNANSASYAGDDTDLNSDCGAAVKLVAMDANFKDIDSAAEFPLWTHADVAICEGLKLCAVSPKDLTGKRMALERGLKAVKKFNEQFKRTRSSGSVDLSKPESILKVQPVSFKKSKKLDEVVVLPNIELLTEQFESATRVEGIRWPAVPIDLQSVQTPKQRLIYDALRLRAELLLPSNPVLYPPTPPQWNQQKWRAYMDEARNAAADAIERSTLAISFACGNAQYWLGGDDKRQYLTGWQIDGGGQQWGDTVECVQDVNKREFVDIKQTRFVKESYGMHYSLPTLKETAEFVQKSSGTQVLGDDMYYGGHLTTDFISMKRTGDAVGVSIFQNIKEWMSARAEMARIRPKYAGVNSQNWVTGFNPTKGRTYGHCALHLQPKYHRTATLYPADALSMGCTARNRDVIGLNQQIIANDRWHCQSAMNSAASARLSLAQPKCWKWGLMEKGKLTDMAPPRHDAAAHGPGPSSRVDPLQTNGYTSAWWVDEQLKPHRQDKEYVIGTRGKVTLYRDGISLKWDINAAGGKGESEYQSVDSKKHYPYQPPVMEAFVHAQIALKPADVHHVTFDFYDAFGTVSPSNLKSLSDPPLAGYGAGEVLMQFATESQLPVVWVWSVPDCSTAKLSVHDTTSHLVMSHVRNAFGLEPAPKHAAVPEPVGSAKVLLALGATEEHVCDSTREKAKKCLHQQEAFTQLWAAVKAVREKYDAKLNGSVGVKDWCKDARKALCVASFEALKRDAMKSKFAELKSVVSNYNIWVKQ